MVVVTTLLAVALVILGLVAVVVRRADGRRLGAATADLDQATADLEAARDELSRTARALGAIPQGVVICDETGREVLRNDAALAFTEARHAEALVEHAIQESLDAARSGASERREVDVLGPPRRMLVISAFPLARGPGPTGAMAVVDDVSERRRLEAVRRDFVANISHELKTPVGALGLLAETIASEDDPAVNRRLAERMTNEALRVGRIIDDLLTLSQIEAEERPVREPVGVRAMVEEAVERVRDLSERQSIVMSIDGVDLRHSVRGDRRQLVSALANLLENACKYSDTGSHVQVDSKLDGSWLELSVSDTGIGIPSGDLERVFERFYRVDRARSRQTGGTGLGLAIVRHVAGNHNGEVRVSSREGEGTTFTLRLPASPRPTAIPVPERSRQPGPT